MPRPIWGSKTLWAVAVLGALGGCVANRKPHFWHPKGTASMRMRSTYTSGIALDDGGYLTGEFIVQMPVDMPAAERPGLLLYFHGDGSALKGWDRKETLDRLAETGRTYKLITVALREPHLGNWWEGEVDENVQFIQEFITDYLYHRYSVDQSHVFFSGISGGADFAGGIFPPKTDYRFHGAAIVTCGGDLPEKMVKLDLKAKPVGPAQTEKFRYYFANVPDDPDFPPPLVEKTVDYFKGLGFKVEREVVGHEALHGTRSYGQGHCSFDTAGWRDRFLSDYFATPDQ